MRLETRGDHAIRWVEHHCIVPSGPARGERVILSDTGRAQVRRLYDRGERDQAVTPALAAYLVLLHTCGRRWQSPCPVTAPIDLWTIWAAASPQLRRFPQRHGERIVCPKLKTRYPRAA